MSKFSLISTFGRLAVTRCQNFGVLGCLLIVVVVAGCGIAEIDGTYGKRRGSPGAESVNGTAVLAGMFESAGHRVTTWRRLSPKLEEADTIVWIPDRFGLPLPAERQFLETWLANKSNRTLVYVGRDYDAAVSYWKHMVRLAPPPQAVEVTRRAAVAQALHDERRSNLPTKEKNCDWFVVEADLPHRSVTTLSGPWAAGIDVKKLEIELDSRLDVPTETEFEQWKKRDWRYSPQQPTVERMLYSDADPLVTRLSIHSNGSQLLVVTNGSFLLNMPLVNHENRKLAGRLINACGPAGRVVFLEGGEEALTIFDKEPGANAPTGFEVFTVWPIGVILIHLTALGILACFALFPVFGRPRELPPPPIADFGQHVTALGELLELTGDHEYAASRIRQYHEQLKHAAKTSSRPRR